VKLGSLLTPSTPSRSLLVVSSPLKLNLKPYVLESAAHQAFQGGA
jgi:hypothetical protein